MYPDSPSANIRTILHHASTIVLSTHINPDGDGLGSECALALALHSLGKTARIVNISSTPSNYAFLNDLFPIETFDAVTHASLIKNADALVLVDANQPSRLADMSSLWNASSARKICIDHHPEPDSGADVLLLDAASAATGMLVYRLLSEEFRVPMNPAIATALYAAIMTDTGSFRFPKTDAAVHTVTAALVGAGADPVRVYEEIFEKGSGGRLRLLGTMLSNLQITHQGRVAWVCITQDMFAATQTSEVDTDAFVTFALQISGVQIALMFTELPGLVKVNVRSKGQIPANALAKEFGGNGHLNAAGARVTAAAMEHLIPRILERAGAYVV
jgi:phosphoesterase RecJ-like protein